MFIRVQLEQFILGTSVSMDTKLSTHQELKGQEAIAPSAKIKIDKNIVLKTQQANLNMDEAVMFKRK